jgi:hypothetical protein
MLRKGWIGGDSEDAAKFRVGTNFKEIYKPKKALKTTCFQGFLTIYTEGSYLVKPC